MNKKMWKKTTLFLVSITLLSLFGSLAVPRVTASPAELLITPQNGVVGETLVARGTIDTLDGDFAVRWDQTLNFTGKAVGDNATTSFVIPPTVGAARPLGRNVTVELIDETLASVVATANFTLFTAFDMQVEAPLPPKQLQEGTSVRFNTTVTGGEPNTVYVANVTVRNVADQTYSAFIPLSNTTTSGFGSANVTYPTDFPAGANMNYTGFYEVSFNETVTKEFFVGLTDKTEYRRNENVQVQASGFKSSELVTADIRTGSVSVSGFPSNVTCSSSGLLTLSWKVPTNATPGAYRITLENATSPGTTKMPIDAQNFTVIGVICLVQATNLADEAVAGAAIEVYNQTAPTVVLTKGNTNSTGWLRFNLDGGNYTFKGLIKNVQVGMLSNQTIMSDTQLPMLLELVNFLATAETEAGQRIPLVDVNLRYKYTTRDNISVTDSLTAQTNTTGIAELRNLFTNTTYQIEALRYGLLFSNTTRVVELSPVSPWVTLNLTLSTYMLNVHALDSKGVDASGVYINVYEWASGVTTPVDSMETSVSGDAFFSLPFGRYILRAYRGEDFLGEAVVDLIEPVAFTFSLRTLNVDIAVRVLDYFGQPIANAEVRIERQVGQDFILVSSQATGSDGSLRLASVIGGDFRVSVYFAGSLIGVKTQFLGAGSTEVVFRAGEYVALLGYPIATGAFVLLIFIVLLIVVAIVFRWRRLVQVFRKRSKR